MIADRRLLWKVMTIAPLTAAVIGFLSALVVPWHLFNQALVVKGPLKEPLKEPKTLKILPKINSIKLPVQFPVQYQGKIFKQVKVSPTKKVIALTFDDGPLPGSTEKVLQILKENNIKATFFLIGRNVQVHPELVKKVLSDGHIIGNHSWSHPYNHQTIAGAAREIDKTSAEIAKITGTKPTLFRPPGGLMHTGLTDYARGEKMGIALWSADSQDYRAHNGPQRLLDNMLKAIKPGGIVLMHDGGSKRTNTVLALPVLIETLRKQGYQFVTLPELINLESKVTKKKAKF